MKREKVKRVVLIVEKKISENRDRKQKKIEGESEYKVEYKRGKRKQREKLNEKVREQVESMGEKGSAMRKFWSF